MIVRRDRLLWLGIAVLVLLGVRPGVAGAQCEVGWSGGFEYPGASGPVNAILEVQTPNGSVVYVGGKFRTIGGVSANCVAMWDGSSWSALGQGIEVEYWNLNGVSALAWWDDGTGPALYAAGDFSRAGGATARNIAKWDGTAWTTLGEGLQGQAFALAVHDDGTGPGLYVGGGFSQAGGQTAFGIARWRSGAWAPVGSGVLGGAIMSLQSATVGGSPVLYAGGAFTQAGFVPLNYVGRWNGSAWTALGSGMNRPVYELALFDDGTGEALYAAGHFTTAGGVTSPSIARWTGTSWSSVGGGVPGVQLGGGSALARFNGPNGPTLLLGGLFDTPEEPPARGLVQWNGSAWSVVSGGPSGYVTSLGSANMPGGPMLIAGGTFLATTDGIRSGSIAIRREEEWLRIGPDSAGPIGSGRSLCVFDAGGGGAVYWGGSAAAGDSAIARWNGGRWEDVGGGVSGVVSAQVGAMVATAGGGQPSLVVGGQFQQAGTQAANNIARWDGAAWSALGGGLNGSVDALVEFDDGSGPALYAAGAFTASGATPVNRIAKWTGAAWVPLGTGMDGRVHALAVYDDGAGPALYAGGAFTTAGSVAARGIARWRGGAWTAIGDVSGNDRTVYALCTRVENGAASLYAGGYFNQIGGVSASSIARWNGSTWSPLGGGVFGVVSAIAALDDGSGPALIVGGSFSHASGVSGTDSLARWNGSAWSAMDRGVNSTVYALATVDDLAAPSTQSLFAAGSFTAAGSRSSKGLARWGRLPDISIEQQPADIDAMPGSAAVFTVGATGPGSLIYRWRRGGVDLADGGRINGASTPTLTVSAVEPGDAGAYDVRIENACGPVWSAAAALTVAPPCPADFDHNGTLDPADVATFVGVWFASLQSGGLEGDFDQSGAVDPADVAAFVQAWFAAVAAGGC